MINFRRFNLEVYDKNKHYVLMKNLSRDEGVYKYISKRFEDWLDEMPKKNKNFTSYVVVRENKYIGMVGALDVTNDKIIELWCAIVKDERHKGNAKDILGEIAPYFVENYSDIRLRINKGNENSKKSAVRNGFVLDKVESDNEVDVYYYFGKKR